MDLCPWDCPQVSDWFPCFDTEICCSPFDTDYFDVFDDHQNVQENDIKPQLEKKIFRPFLSLTTVETVVTELNAAVNKRTLK